MKKRTPEEKAQFENLIIKSYQVAHKDTQILWGKIKREHPEIWQPMFNLAGKSYPPLWCTALRLRKEGRLVDGSQAAAASDPTETSTSLKKTTPSEATSIREKVIADYRSGIKPAQLAAKYNVEKKQVYNWINCERAKAKHLKKAARTKHEPASESKSSELANIAQSLEEVPCCPKCGYSGRKYAAYIIAAPHILTTIGE